MRELLTAAQMRAIEQTAIESGAVTGLELMERAGRGVVAAVFAEWPDLVAAPHRAVVLCGPGNNGGDGFVVARMLKEWGWEVEVFLYGDASKLPPDAKVNYERWAIIGGVEKWPPDDAKESSADLLVDAIFGAGLSRPPPDEVLSPLVNHYVRGATSGKTVAIDAPTGLCMDSGRALSGGYGAVHACLTVTFHRARPGHFIGDGPHYCGKVSVKDIGLIDHHPSQPEVEDKMQGARLLHQTPWREHIAKGDNSDHKYSHGHALILSGGAGKTGAARLAARGALRIGAGVVTIATPPSAQMEVAGQITALMLRRIKDANALAEVLQDARINALCLGPGMGVERARDLVPVALGEGGGKARPAVLDADALTAYAEEPETLFAMLHTGCVLTPHGGEFARLFPDIAERLSAMPTKGPAYSKVDATREAAKRAGCVVLYKGPDTVIAAPGGLCSINSAQYERAAPWLATAGTGDVLAGFITGLLARGFAPMQAAETAAWLHVECARSFGPGLIAEDLPEHLPNVFRDLRD